jgi:hypothetical protein
MAANAFLDHSEALVSRPGRRQRIWCRMTYLVEPWRDGLLRWFLVGVEELQQYGKPFYFTPSYANKTS